MLLFPLLAGCGLLVNGTTRHVPVQSTPSGAEVWVNGAYVGRTPVRIEADPDEEQRVEIRQEGRAAQTFVVKSHLSVVFIVFDVLLTLGVGIAIDAITDGWDVPSPESLDVALIRHDP